MLQTYGQSRTVQSVVHMLGLLKLHNGDRSAKMLQLELRYVEKAIHLSPEPRQTLHRAQRARLDNSLVPSWTHWARGQL